MTWQIDEDIAVFREQISDQGQPVVAGTHKPVEPKQRTTIQIPGKLNVPRKYWLLRSHGLCQIAFDEGHSFLSDQYESQ